MNRNPYAEAIRRWFLILICTIGCALCLFVAGGTLAAGATEGCFGRPCLSSQLWTAQDHPTQFWFYVLFHITGGGIFGRIAWKAWSG